MITRASIQEVTGGFELRFSERFPHREQTGRNWVDFKQTKEDARQIAQEAHTLHITNLIEDLREELRELNSPILGPLIEELSRVLSSRVSNHLQLCRETLGLWQYVSLVTTDRAKLIANELFDTVKYEMSTEQKKWILQ